MPMINWGDPRVADKFWDRLAPCPISGCWIWEGPCINKVPVYTYRRNGKSTQASVRKVVYEATVGGIGERRARYNCGLNICCNPAHTIIATTEHPESQKNRTREYNRRYHLAQRGIDSERFDEMLKEQCGRCAICGVSFVKTKQWLRPCVDHCHVTGAVRGLLCGHCNTGIGHLQDDFRVLDSAASYLRKYHSP